MRAFEAQHDGSLPQQLQSNIQILNGIQSQLQAAHSAHERAMQQQTYLNSLQKQYETMGDSADVPSSIDNQLESARAQLADLQARYTDDHPDIKKLKETIAGLEKLKKDMGAEAKEKLETNNATAAQVQAMTPLVQLQSQIKINKMEIQTSTEQIQRLEQAGQMYQARLNATPAVEAEMGDMMRDFGNMKKGISSSCWPRSRNPRWPPAWRGSNRAHSSASSIRPVFRTSLSFPDRFKFSLRAIGCRLGVGGAVRIRLGGSR